MLRDVYLGNLLWIVPLLLATLLVPIIKFIPSMRKKGKVRFDADFVGFLIFLILANVAISYIVGIFAYVRVALESTPVRSYMHIWIITFISLSALQVIAYFLWRKQEQKALISVSMSPNDYKNLILSAEKGARLICILPKRIHVMFKTPALIRYTAERRFGTGSEYIQAYEDEHTERKAALYQGLNSGLIIREMHNRKALISYVQQRAHHDVENIEKVHFIDMLNEWKRVLAQYSSNYFVRLTDENLPLKYELIDNKKMVMHESVGSNSRDRLNAIMIESTGIVSTIANDFSQVWERVPQNQRSNVAMIEFIDNVLLPLLN